MAETGLTLFIDLKQGSRIDLETAANASLAWARLIKTIGQHIDPMTVWEVELDSSLRGSQKIRTIIKLPEGAEARAAIKGAIVTALIFLAMGAGEWTIGKVLDYIFGPDAPPGAATLSVSDRESIAQEIVAMLNGTVGRQEATEVFSALEADEDVTGVGATSSFDHRPTTVIPRANFPESEPQQEDDGLSERKVIEEVELTLVRPVLTTDTSRRWGFQSRYGAFGAPIHDREFLAALSEGRLNVPMAQGIVMVVEIEITEVQDGGLWRPTERVVLRVLRIVPPPVQTSLQLDGPQ